MTSEERQALLDFVAMLRDDLGLALEYMDDRELQELGARALEAIDERGEFTTVSRAIDGRQYDPALDAFGLSGPELAFKLAVVDRARSEVRAAQEAPRDETDIEPRDNGAPGERAPRPRWLRRLRSRLAKLLGSADVVLESLVGALAGAGEVIKELKQGLEKALEE